MTRTHTSPDWMDSALCTEVDPDLHYPDTGQTEQTREAKRICSHCPVTVECLAHVLHLEATGVTRQRYGVWGGLSPKERTKLVKGAA